MPAFGVASVNLVRTSEEAVIARRSAVLN